MMGLIIFCQIDVRIKLPSAPRQIRLDKDEVGPVGHSVFAAFVHWLYKGFSSFGLDGVSKNQVDATLLMKLWCFAGRIGVPLCQNHCIEGIEMWRVNSRTIQTSALGWVCHANFSTLTFYFQIERTTRTMRVEQV
jgi:hypothetical protein